MLGSVSFFRLPARSVLVEIWTSWGSSMRIRIMMMSLSPTAISLPLNRGSFPYNCLTNSKFIPRWYEVEEASSSIRRNWEVEKYNAPGRIDCCRQKFILYYFFLYLFWWRKNIERPAVMVIPAPAGQRHSSGWIYAPRFVSSSFFFRYLYRITNMPVVLECRWRRELKK